jgi:type IV secretory pathway VirB4 component
VDLFRIKIGTWMDGEDEFLPVYLDSSERYQHALIIGKSGTGKSTLIENWWQQDSYFRFAKILIEPHGFLAKKVWSLNRGRGVYCSIDNPVSINPMAGPYQPKTICDIIAEAVNQVIAICTPNEKFTVKMREILDKEIVSCLNDGERTLRAVHERLQRVKGDEVTRSGILARLDFIISDPVMDAILCGDNPIEWGDFIQKGETFIFDGFGMSQEKLVFTGTLISQAIKNYFRFQRPDEYRPVIIYVDECQLFVNTNFTDILKEGRKFKLSAILATQDFAVIDEKIKRVLLNVGTIIAYKLGANEASQVSRELNCQAEILQTLEKYTLAFMTPSKKGILKSPTPPIVIEYPLPTCSDRIVVRDKVTMKANWHPLQPYPQGATTNAPWEVSDNAPKHRAETPLSPNDDG